MSFWVQLAARSMVTISRERSDPQKGELVKESGVGLPSDKNGMPTGDGGVNVPAPLDKCAFEHPETRAAWEKARSKVKRGFRVWHSLYALSWVAYLILFVNASNGDEEERAAGILAAATFCYLAALYLRRDAMACLKRIRRVLENHPWQLIPTAHRPSGVKDVMGVPVQLRYHTGEELTGLMSARHPLRRRRWPEGLDHGAWYAGDVWQARGASTRGFGVLAVPGGSELMEVSSRVGVR